MSQVEKGSAEHEILNAQQMGVKIILNSIYGLLGLKTSLYGDMISGMMVTAMCRWTTNKVIDKYGESVIEIDTDGLIIDREISEEEVNTWLSDLNNKTFNFNNCFMEMELEQFGRAYFYAMKNYVVQDGDKFIIHGSSIKSSRACKLVDRAIQLAIQHVFNGKPMEEVIREAYDFDVDLEYFEERVKLAKDPSEYDDPLDLKLFLAEQVKLKTGQEPAQGLQISYFIGKDQLPFKELKEFNRKQRSWNYTYTEYIKNITQLNLKYYRDLIDKILEKFEIRKVEQLSLF